MDLDLTLVIILLIILGIVVFIEIRFIRSRKNDGIERALERDESFNSLNTTQAVGRALKEKGRDTSEADMELLRASLACDRGNYIECMDSVKRAKRLLDTAPDIGFANEATTDTKKDQGDPELEEIPEQATIAEVKKLPPNYLESKFMIETTKDDIDRCAAEGKDVTASVCLLDEAKMAFECKEYDIALTKSLKAKKASETAAGPVKEKIAEITPPVKMVTRDIVNDSSRVGICPNCGAEALPDDNFCAKCGKPIERKRVCPTCKAEVSEDDVFCRKCGTEVRTAYQCPECGAVATDDDPVCVKCGARFQK